MDIFWNYTIEFFLQGILYYLTNRWQFSMVYTFINHKMTSKNVQNSSGTTSRRRVVSLPSFGHFMASFYGLQEFRPQKTAVDLLFTITWKKYGRNWIFFR